MDAATIAFPEKRRRISFVIVLGRKTFGFNSVLVWGQVQFGQAQGIDTLDHFAQFCDLCSAETTRTLWVSGLGCGYFGCFKA